uniref:Damaged DNA binding 2 n=1 Tax=Tanacetum cinerariifolium TaxID=118510 RepID=A0A6L2JD21_TANCI|nr:damaged DNA binding 2 [Tanacetum cinerariifolium]
MTSTTKGVEARNSTAEDVEARIVLHRVLKPGLGLKTREKKRMKANRKENAKAKDKPNSGMYEPNEENNMPADNVRGETFEKHDIYMNELLKSLKTVDKDGITEDPFISVEKYVEMYPMYDETKCGQRPPRVSALAKDGWKASCWKIIALDGCFLKKPNQGEIITAIGRDEDLSCSRGNGLTLMSDQHKTQVEVQVEQTKDQAEIDLTQVEQTIEQTQDQVQP